MSHTDKQFVPMIKRGGQSPCYHCEERRENCHDHCEKFQAYRAKIDSVNELRESKREGRYTSQMAVKAMRHNMKYGKGGKAR